MEGRIAEGIGIALFWFGMLLVAAGVVGIFRLRDVYARIKAMALINGLGAFVIHLSGVFLVPMGYGYRGALVAVLFLISGPALAQVIARAAHRLGMNDGLEVDDLARR
jgi:monovalent cation/proton antiporter MnhG/PhaG subunit